MKRVRIDLGETFEELGSRNLELRKTTAEGLDVDYGILLPKSIADELMSQLQDTVEYYEGDLAKVRVFGKWHPVPRQTSAYGDDGTKYNFSGISMPAKPWNPPLALTRDLIAKLTGYSYNFVLVNRYRSGSDYIGEHRDNEPDMDRNTPIASLSLGQHRDFVLRHGDCRKSGSEKRKIPPVKMELQHGSLLLMNPPTNTYWYHSLPVRKKSPGVRINLTFRKIIKK